MKHVFVLCILFLPTCFARGEDWPQFRGPGGAGVSSDKGLPVEWSATKNIAWKTALPGPGSSSPVTFGDRIYVTCYSGYGLVKQAPGTKTNLKRHLVCLHRDDGRILWKADAPASGHEMEYQGYLHMHGYASQTPVVDETGIYVFYGASGAAAYDHDGQRKWHTSCGTKHHDWGSGTSPTLYKNLIIIAARIESKSLIALDKDTGKEVWRRPLEFGHGTPTLVHLGDATELVFAHEKDLIGVDPATGKELWTCHVGFFSPIAMPLAHKDVLYVMTRDLSVAIRLGGRGDVSGTHLLWKTNRGSHIATPIYYDGHLYFPHDEKGVVYCIDAATGKVVYEERLPSFPRYLYASPVIADGKLYYVSQNDGVFVLAAKSRYELLAHNTIAGDAGRANATPAISRGRILLRTDGWLYCIGERFGK
jgi:outer membrane protein assembly factor BamB